MQTVRVTGVRKKDSLWKQIKKYKVLIVMTIPGVLYFFINNYLPMFGVIIAFKDLDYTKGFSAVNGSGSKTLNFCFAPKKLSSSPAIRCCTIWFLLG